MDGFSCGVPYFRLSADRRELLASARLNIKGAESSISLLGECPICLWPVDSSRTMQTLACGHTFCEQCWLDYILSRISEGVSTGEALGVWLGVV